MTVGIWNTSTENNLISLREVKDQTTLKKSTDLQRKTPHEKK